MMDKQKKDSPSGTLSSGKTPGFKIPKKKPDDWCEDVPASSPLSRLQDNDFRNVTFRKTRGSSYEEYNVPRNKNSHAYFTLRFNRPPCIKDFNEHTQEREIGKKHETQNPVQSKEQIQETPSTKVCRNVSNSSISYKDLNLGSGKSSSLIQESQGSSKEQKNALKDIEVSPGRRERTYCFKCKEHLSKKSSLSPSSNHLSSSSSEQFTDCTLNCTLDSPAKKNTAREQIIAKAEENKKSSDDGCSSDSQKSSLHSGASSRTRRKPLLATNDSMDSIPIVLSSDEDEGAQKERKPGCSRTVKKTPVERKSPSPSKDVEPMDHSGDLEDADTAQQESDSTVLSLKFLNVHYGKLRGRVTELAKFTATSIAIPVKVPLHKIPSLTLETRKLQKYGFWVTKGGCLVRSSAVIILWMTPSYVPVVERQMELSTTRSQTCKSNEFIFLELAEPLTGREQSLMSEIMVEASKHGSPSLAEVLSCEEIYSLLKSLPSEECSFKLKCFSSGSQPPEAKKLKSTYSIMQKWNDGHLSLSMVPEQNLLGEAHRSGVPIRLLVYPPPPTKGGLAVSNEDLECLEHGEFLNDVIIDFYLKYLMLEIFPKPFADRCHIFSSFFFKCLTRKEKSSNDINPEISPAERRHHGVKNWTRHVDIFTKDFIFVPVNENSHWYLAVICFPWLETALYEDRREQDAAPFSKIKAHSNSSVIVFNDRLSKTEENTEDSNSGSEGSCSSGPGQRNLKPKESHFGRVCKRPCILIFDSLTTGSVRTTVQVLREYLKVECQVKQKSEREFSRSSMRELYPKVPKQNNSTDCGLYLLQYVESFSQKPIENFEPPLHLENWFPSCIVKNKREEIRDLILRLHVEQTRKG